MLDRAAKKAAAVAVGVLAQAIQTYTQVRDFLGGRKAQPFR